VTGADNGRNLLEITPAKRPTNATLDASPSKSITHRAILIGLLVPHIRIQDPLIASDTVSSLRFAHALGARSSAEAKNDATARMLQTLGEGMKTIKARHDQGDTPDWTGIALHTTLKATDPSVPKPLLAGSYDLHIEGPQGEKRDPLPIIASPVDLGNSGTTLRIGAAIAALAEKSILLSGDESLLTRPMAPLLHALEQLGASCKAKGENGRPPIQIQGPLQGGQATLDGGVSSQYISAVLMAAHGTDQDITLQVQGRPASAPYIRLTVDLLHHFGGQVQETTEGDTIRYHVPGDARLSPGTIKIPGDWSSASFPLVAAAITGGSVQLRGLDPKSEQGDRVVLDALAAAGCKIRWIKEDGTHILRLEAPEGHLKPFKMNLNATPDLLPPLGVLAARASGTSRFTGIAHARIKETDRIRATAQGLEALGFDAHEEEDSLEVTGDPNLPLPPATIETHGDHRILMAFAVLGLTGPGPVRLTQPGCYHVSYPHFRLDLDRLGGHTTVVAPKGDTDRPKTPTRAAQERP
jgi:3-phosphoshikimate 1-carboxyvinyltransferase